MQMNQRIKRYSCLNGGLSVRSGSGSVSSTPRNLAYPEIERFAARSSPFLTVDIPPHDALQSMSSVVHLHPWVATSL